MATPGAEGSAALETNAVLDARDVIHAAIDVSGSNFPNCRSAAR
jgi:hypothetical protein